MLLMGKQGQVWATESCGCRTTNAGPTERKRPPQRAYEKAERKRGDMQRQGGQPKPYGLATLGVPSAMPARTAAVPVLRLKGPRVPKERTLGALRRLALGDIYA